MTTTTEPSQTVERNNARTRWLHGAVYVCVLVLMFTGWWLTLGNEGDPSVLAELVDRPDTEVHTQVGWAFVVILSVGVVLGCRAAWTLLSDSVRFRRTDLRWFLRWPIAMFTGRFGRHEGHFDPGQRIANLVMIVLLTTVVISGIGLWGVSGGPAFVWYRRIHLWSTYLLTPVLAGHILIASGVLPGYRGVWRAMHLGGRLRRRDAARVWPGWLEQQDGAAPARKDSNRGRRLRQPKR